MVLCRCPGGEFAGEPEQLFQVGEQLAGHVDAVRVELTEQVGCGYRPGLAGRGPGRISGRGSLRGEGPGRRPGGGDLPGRCALAR